MNQTRDCERCSKGIETCFIGSFYTCSLCDAPGKTSEARSTRKQPTGVTWWDQPYNNSIAPAPLGSTRTVKHQHYQAEVSKSFKGMPASLPTYRSMQAALDVYGEGFIVRPIIDHRDARVVRWQYPQVWDTQDLIPSNWIETWTKGGL